MDAEYIINKSQFLLLLCFYSSPFPNQKKESACFKLCKRLSQIKTLYVFLIILILVNNSINTTFRKVQTLDSHLKFDKFNYVSRKEKVN